jgi:two-component system phosphate regulon response regulator PhoB
METTHLLLVDPDPVAPALAEALRAEGHRVDLLTDPAIALNRAETRGYDLVLTEIDLGRIDGFELCRRLRQHSKAPILVTTRRASEIDRVVAFEIGVDDYVLKPYFIREVVLRVRARLRPNVPSPSMALRLGALEIDTGTRRVTLDGQRVALTPTEFTLLSAIARRQGTVATRSELLREVWELPDGEETRTLDTHVRRLRDKLGHWGDHVETLRGVGYRLVVPTAPQVTGL